jgi:adenine phosphoribosyltransferase
MTTASIEERIRETVRTVPDFPKPGIMFRDITPLLMDPVLCRDMVYAMADKFRDARVDKIAGIESRGFLFGFLLANHMNLPFVLVRKKGKLPADTVRFSYALEYGNAEIEMHKDSIVPGDHVLIHDDLLATGGTAGAAANLVESTGGVVAGFSFLIELSELAGVDSLRKHTGNIYNLVAY